MDKVVGPVTIGLQGKSKIHAIPVAIFLDKTTVFSILRIQLNVKSTATHARIICCKTKEASEEIKKMLNGRVTDVDESLSISMPECFVSQIVGSGGLAGIVWEVDPPAEVIDATVFVIREIDGEEKDDTVTMTAIVHSGKREREEKKLEAGGEQKTKRRRRW
jgi:hypothetical protein